MDPYLGTITIWPGAANRVPDGWVACNGQTLSINQYTALYSLLGTIWGGDGVSNFGVPDLRSRVAIHPGQGGGLPNNYTLAQKGGAESTTMNPSQVAAHTHTYGTLTFPLTCNPGAGNLSTPVGTFPASTAVGYNIYATQSSGDPMTGTPIGSTAPVSGASSAPIATLSPVLAMTYIMAVQGLFPPRP